MNPAIQRHRDNLLAVAQRFERMAVKLAAAAHRIRNLAGSDSATSTLNATVEAKTTLRMLVDEAEECSMLAEAVSTPQRCAACGSVIGACTGLRTLTGVYCGTRCASVIPSLPQREGEGGGEVLS